METVKRGFCANCGIKKEIGKNGLCLPCNKDKYALKECYHCINRICSSCGNESLSLMEGKCRQCALQDNFIPEKTDKCIQCGIIKETNNTELCLNCYLSVNSEEKRYSVQIFSCAECNNLYYPESPQDYLCKTCKPECEECGEKFSPIDRTDLVCNKCFSTSDGLGSCKSCGEPTRNLGLCSSCKDTGVTLGKCINCKTNIVSGTICADCAKKVNSCPDCLKEKYIMDYICQECQYKRTAMMTEV